MGDEEIDDVWKQVTGAVLDTKNTEQFVAGKNSTLSKSQFVEMARTTVQELKENHLEFLARQPIENLENDYIQSFERYSDGLPLQDFERAMELVPSLVNLVSLADAIPLDGSSLPFDLRYIAAKCRGAVYFAPRRFTAVQLAFDQPRSRVLLFHTGRVVGTGCDGPMAAKLAVCRALKAIADDAGIRIGIRRFAVINQVGAIGINARLDCDHFANEHSSDSHYDKACFVGLAWRPRGESICVEAYSTGKLNLPGSRRFRDLLKSFGRMAPELYRCSKNPELAAKFSTRLQMAHKPSDSERSAPRATNRKRKMRSSGGSSDLFGDNMALDGLGPLGGGLSGGLSGELDMNGDDDDMFAGNELDSLF
jgi:TATA-box binding protein (TBP) (component of TFIID and TFIIIB)